jgi:hypothetical protein
MWNIETLTGNRFINSRKRVSLESKNKECANVDKIDRGIIGLDGKPI